ncbi:UDP-glycosyltransferase 2-like [Abrus precatorius]|uniref:Glycosyltransferase n=1 Tax=Abrus precatorius TaxID=3816 RepID=A0A8B8LNR6_ABRPR|nr:UDP-glycosyltransferase 2-like [Abrus precatorius]
MAKDTIVLYPTLGRGHLISMVELGKLILTHHPSLSITILILTPPPTIAPTFAYDSITQYISTISTTTPSITFHHISSTPLPTSTLSIPSHLLPLQLSLDNTQNVSQTLHSLSKTTNIKAIVMDFMNFNSPQTLTQNLNIPTYFYYTSGASTLAILLHFPTIHQNATKPLKDLPMQLQIPGLPTLSTNDLPKEAKDPSDHSYQVFLEISKTMRGSVGIIVNTFEAIEEGPVRASSEDGTTPPLFCIGPVISSPYGEEDKGCLSWLDSQPSQSVVLLSFGSMRGFSKTQLREIAIGLEMSEQRFLWVVRSELDGVDSVEPSLDELLPKGFLERTKEKGMVVRNWAPQAEILSHDSVGGFVTHCGWNSVLEAVCEGVPMVAWPLYAEQNMNRVILVQEMKVALAVNESKNGLVSATELGDRVKELMESDTGKEIRHRIFKMKISAVEARSEGGSSRVALDTLVQLWKQN